MSAILDAAYRYRDRGWKVIPLFEKRPICKGWAERKYTVGDFRNRNVGVVLGSWSGGLVDVDLDCAEALELADIYLPKTDAIFGRASKPRSHRLYYATDAVHEVFSDTLIAGCKRGEVIPIIDPLTGEIGDAVEPAVSKPVMLELRSDTANGAAKFTMFPCSTHPSGERVRWDSDGEPRVLDAAKLRLACAWLAVGCIVLRYCDEWVDDRPAHNPTLDLPRRIWRTWPGVAKPIYQWLGLYNPNEDARPRRKIPDDIDVPAIVAMIDNDFDRDGWVKVGMAIYACGADYSTFLEFSRRSPNHHHEATVKRIWRSFKKPPRSVGIGTLRYLAKGNR
jgi:hypothetical protein